MDSPIDSPIDLNALTQRERSDLLWTLLTRGVGENIGPILPPPAGFHVELPRDAAIVPLCSNGPLEPVKTHAVHATMQRMFKAQRLIILEPYYDFCEHRTVSEDRADRVERTVEIERRGVLMPRGRWTVRDLRVGDCSLFEGVGSVNGDAFGLDPLSAFNAPTARPGQLVSVYVSHEAPVPVRFSAIALGRVYVPKEHDGDPPATLDT